MLPETTSCLEAKSILSNDFIVRKISTNCHLPVFLFDVYGHTELAIAAGPFVPSPSPLMPSFLQTSDDRSTASPSLSRSFLFSKSPPRVCPLSRKNDRARPGEPAPAGKLLPPPRLPRAEKLLKVHVPTLDSVSVVDGDQQQGQQQDYAHVAQRQPAGVSLVGPPHGRYADEV